jgi:hypothetical protein
MTAAPIRQICRYCGMYVLSWDEDRVCPKCNIGLVSDEEWTKRLAADHTNLKTKPKKKKKKRKKKKKKSSKMRKQTGVRKRESRAREPRRTAKRVAAATVLFLPTDVRDRYEEEYLSELWDIAQSDAGAFCQLRYALRQLVSVIPMRSALRFSRRKRAVP